ncbi:MAG: IS1595 family transposase [Chitinophagaceae bacterium]|nr:IS1595 family transposase [Chitinophagaceae bacterium]MCW5925859.1 IS1595 family transposase [Chitinophagaceae bacterium]
MNTFKNLTQLLDFFKDEETCKAYYEQKRWGGNVACPHCGSLKVYRTNRGFKCGEKLCYKKFTVTTQTIFENTKIGLRTWFAAMYLISTSKKGVSSLQLAEQLGITQKTAWFVLHRIREMLKDNGNEQLEGEVEVDETYVGGKNKNRHKNKKVENSQGRSAKDKTPVVGLIQRDGKVRLFVVPNTESETLHTIMGSNVAENSTVITDAYRAYNGLDSRYTHVTVKHEEGGYVIKIGDQKFHTNNIENFWSIFKRGIIGIYHFVSAKHLQRYCSEFGYRYNERELTGVKKFDIALTKVSSTRITYNTLIGK